MTTERLEDSLVKSVEHPTISSATIMDRSQNDIARGANRQDFRPFIDNSNPFVLDMGDGRIIQAKGSLATAKTEELAQAKVAPIQTDPADVRAADRDLKAATAVEEPSETSAEAAKHGKIVWHKNADGKYVPEQPPGWPACPDPAKSPNEFWSWVRYGHATGAPDDKPQDGDTVDGHKFHKTGHNF